MLDISIGSERRLSWKPSFWYAQIVVAGARIIVVCLICLSHHSDFLVGERKVVFRISECRVGCGYFVLVAAMNPCPCGYYNDPVKECTCSLTNVLRYQKRISGPLLDRIDIHIEVPRVDYEKLSGDRLGETSATIRDRVEKARERQRARFAGTALQCNGDMGPAEVRQYCVIDDASKSLLRAAMQQMQMSTRVFHRILKLARTIADLAGSDKIETAHLAEAIQYRPRKQA